MKCAIITGASRGVGLALARCYASHGWKLVLCSGHNKEALQKAEQELQNITEVVSFFGDISLSDTSAKLVKLALSRFGQIDLVINNAGIAHIGLLSDLSDEQWRHIMGTNLDSVFYLSKAVIPHMVHNHSGKILNISSVWGEVGASCEAAYSASKGAINALTKALAKELAPSHISVNAVSLGVIDTSMNSCFDEEEKQALAEDIPWGRFATPEEAAAMCYQITESPGYLTGQIIRFEGGWI